VIVFSKGKTKTLTVTMGSQGKSTRREKEPLAELPPPPMPAEKWMYVYDVEYPYMGIQMLDLTKQLAKFFKVKDGVLISEVVSDSPAEEAGMRAGDILVAFDSRTITSTQDVYDALKESESDEEVELILVHKGDERTVEITLGTNEDRNQATKEYYFGLPHLEGKELKIPPIKPIPPLEFDLDLKEFKEGMKRYQEEMKELRKELLDLKKELRAMKEKA
jgi:membrane-associated protease RseP (regulator of RpoE activity)